MLALVGRNHDAVAAVRYARAPLHTTIIFHIRLNHLCGVLTIQLVIQEERDGVLVEHNQAGLAGLGVLAHAMDMLRLAFSDLHGDVPLHSNKDEMA